MYGCHLRTLGRAEGFGMYVRCWPNCVMVTPFELGPLLSLDSAESSHRKRCHSGQQDSGPRILSARRLQRD